MKDINKIWEEMLRIFELELTGTSYRTWFAPLVPKEINEELKIFYLESPEEFVCEVLSTRYIENLNQKAETVLGEPYKVVVQMKPDEEELQQIEEEKKIKENPKQILKDEYYFNPRYSFENFVVGNNNKYAYAAALAVADAPSLAYNPLFLYGGSGLGKTHLMHAIGHYILENYPEKKVLYVSSEMFTNELIKSLEDNKKTRMRAFKNKYRNVDVLLIDDIQFIEGKEATQEEFFHTFNSLYDLNKQIIISSDRAPNKLTKLEDRLTSRFQWNMIADIQPPDYETRVAILRKKAELENLELDDDLFEVISLIAEKIKFNIRELEGAFTRITSFSAIMKEKITVKFARNVLKDIVSANDFNITCESIKKTVCKHFNIKQADMESAKRTRNLAFPRQIAMYLCRDMMEISLPKIGEAFGGRDHTTVLHAIDKISSEIKTNQDTAEVVEHLRNEISGK
ncbi:chromosomal replication initiator protein DnaA [bacterium 210820-DFI.6.37]|nr:chromosomal replication initiator protein DnaA [bacterium 210820-DFI.6.37]